MDLQQLWVQITCESTLLAASYSAPRVCTTFGSYKKIIPIAARAEGTAVHVPPCDCSKCLCVNVGHVPEAREGNVIRPAAVYLIISEAPWDLTWVTCQSHQG